VRGALADAAVGDRRPAVVEALLAVELRELLVGAERAVVGGGLAPRDVDGGRDVAGALRLLLRQVGRRLDLAAELVGAAHVDEVLLPDRGDDLVAERADRQVGVLRDVRGRGPLGDVLDELAAVELPLLAPAVEQLHVGVAVQLELPVGVGGEPVVVAAVEHDGVVVGDALGAQQLGEVVAVDRGRGQRAAAARSSSRGGRRSDVAAVVGGHVLVDLDEDDARVVQVGLGPVGVDEHVRAAHAGSSFTVGVPGCRGRRTGSCGTCRC
jgi:hypothetical protein